MEQSVDLENILIPKGNGPPDFVLFRDCGCLFGLRRAGDPEEDQWPVETFLYNMHDASMVMGCGWMAPPPITGMTPADFVHVYRVWCEGDALGWEEVPRALGVRSNFISRGKNRIPRENLNADERVWDDAITALLRCWKFAVRYQIEEGSLTWEDLREPSLEEAQAMVEEMSRPQRDVWKLRGPGIGKSW